MFSGTVEDDEPMAASDVPAAPSDSAHRHEQPSNAPLLLLCLVILIPGAIQIIGGFSDVGLLEEWSFFELFARQGPIFFLGTDSAIASQAMRPLTVFPAGVSWLMDNDSFRGYHLVQGAALTLRCAAMYLLLAELRVGRRVALAVALVFSLFPAWTGLFVFRTVHFHIASAMITLAGWLLLRSRERNRPLEWVAMTVALVIGVMSYEGYYSVVVFMPLLLLVNGRVPIKRFVLLATVWFTGPILNGFRIVWIMAFGPPQYQEDLVTEQGRGVDEVVSLFGRTLWGAGRAMVDPPFGHRLTWLAALAILLTLVALWTVPDGAASIDRRRWLLSAAVALAITPVTTVVYWPEPAHLVDPLRIFSVSAFPATLAMACFLAAIEARRWRSTLGSLIAVSALLSAVGQRTHWHDASHFQERLLGAVALEMAASGTPTNVVLFDVDRRAGGVYTLLEPYASIATRYLFDNPTLNVTICQSTPEEAAALPAESSCHVADGMIAVTAGTLAPIETVLVLQLQDGDLTVVSSPEGAPVELPPRVREALPCVADGACLPVPSFAG